jgi:NAD(P)-dependent dehydrogenase (short-subunit alcohol dehydrogenase family)
MNGIAQTLRLELSPWNIPNILIGCGGIQTAAPGRTDRELERSFRTWPADRLDLYARSLRKIRDGFAEFDDRRTPPEEVARAIHAALTASRPKRKYLVGHQAGLMGLLSLLPSSVMEWALRSRL